MTGSASREPFCHAPFVSMEFRPTGDVWACCANALFPLGNVASDSLAEIWRGPRAQLLRDHIGRDDLSLGCSICAHRVRHDEAERPFEAYRHYPISESDDPWPSRLSFSLHNTCNLECIMCGPYASSRIRTRREGLAPLPHAYSERFFSELGPFLDRCANVDFVGGEPFLVHEHFRVWDMLIERGVRTRCSVTTNGTVWNREVERVLDAFDTDVRFSIDGATPETFELVRVGARFDPVMRNLERFRAYADSRGTTLALSWCFIRQNWFELAEMMVLAEGLGLAVTVQTVIEPEFGVQRMDTASLRGVLTGMLEQDSLIEHRLTVNRQAWKRQLEMVQAELSRRESGEAAAPYMEPPSPNNGELIVRAIRGTEMLTFRPRPRRAEQIRSEARLGLARWGTSARPATASTTGNGSMTMNRDGIVTCIDLSAVFPEFDAPALPRPLPTLLDELCTALGGHLWIADQEIGDDVVHQTLACAGRVRDLKSTLIRLVSFRVGDDYEIIVGRGQT